MTFIKNVNAFIRRGQNEYLPTLVKNGATIGANATIVCGNTIGRFAFIGAGAVVNNDVPDYALMVGVPARQIGWMSEFGEQIPLPLDGSGEYVCPQSGQQYQLENAILNRLIE